MQNKKRMLVGISETRYKEVEVLIDEDDDSSVGIKKVEKMYEDGEIEMSKDDIIETFYFEE